jgi:hypothetical protein
LWGLCVTLDGLATVELPERIGHAGDLFGCDVAEVVLGVRDVGVAGELRERRDVDAGPAPVVSAVLRARWILKSTVAGRRFLMREKICENPS